MAKHVEIFEEGPRDGLQNEAAGVATSDKIALVDTLSEAGFARIEVASFVSPKWVPQMADSVDVLGGVRRVSGVRYAALTPNMRGLWDALKAGADEGAIFGPASDGFSKTNINATIDESLARFAPVIEAAGANGVRVGGYVSCVVECPYDGKVAPAQVAQVAESLWQMGCYDISLGDTIGQGTPEAVDAMLAAVEEVVPTDRLAGHSHDTSGCALDNIEAALARGVRVFDAAVGGLGGCPFAPEAAGNVATERVNDRLRDLGYETGLDADVLARAAQMSRALRGNQEAT